MLSIGNKTFMNLQEAVGWLLENNALPFQSTANYVGNTEIAMSTLINPSPAKVRVGSIIFFADSKVSTVVGVTSNSFIVSDQYNDLVDDVVYVSNVAINASGHLIVTLSNGDTIDAGLIKQVTGFSIDSSQHLIVTYNDASTTDLGAIFSGNVSISGNLTVAGGISGATITGDSIVEIMAGYSFAKYSEAIYTPIYAGVCKNGNKLTFVLFASITGDAGNLTNPSLCRFSIPSEVGAKLYPYTLVANNVLMNKQVEMWTDLETSIDVPFMIKKQSDAGIVFELRGINSKLTNGTTYLFRVEATFLLSDALNS